MCQKHESYTKITKESLIEITYADTIPQYSIFANIQTQQIIFFIATYTTK